MSNWAAWQIAKALGIAECLGISRLSSLQAYYSVVGRDLEREITPMLDSEGVGLLVWSPLAGGFLSGKLKRGTEAPAGSRWSTNAFPPVDKERGYDAIDAIQAIADQHRASVAQVALAWLLHQKSVSSVLIGAKRMDQLDDNLKAAEIALTPDDLAVITEVSKVAPEYPRWMFDMWSQGRTSQLANSRR